MKKRYGKGSADSANQKPSCFERVFADALRKIPIPSWGLPRLLKARQEEKKALKKEQKKSSEKPDWEG